MGESNGESGVRFVDVPGDLRITLKNWVASRAQEVQPEEPRPISPCTLTDLSLGGCYVETESPFPEHTELMLCLKVGGMELQAQGVVRVMHSGFGMGIEFASGTPQQREEVENFIHSMIGLPEADPELLIVPQPIEQNAGDQRFQNMSHATDDPLREFIVEPFPCARGVFA